MRVTRQPSAARRETRRCGAAEPRRAARSPRRRRARARARRRGVERRGAAAPAATRSASKDRAAAARATEATGIDEQSVAEVHHRRRDSGRRQRPARLQARDRPAPTPSRGLTARQTTSARQQAQPERRAAETAGHEELIAGPRAAPQQRSRRRVAEHADRQRQLARRREVAADERRPGARRRVAHARAPSPAARATGRSDGAAIASSTARARPPIAATSLAAT